uniref:(California timema) hypothetical protein n=1 Tax=Timema californicum TaxID=61474 RepID=A0A7R9IXY0_TIMCA|nr:unnamed protein product [Timema californicum]
MVSMIDVKSASNYNTGFSVIGNPSVFICPPPHLDPYTSQDLYNPVYEELSNGSGDRGDSDPDSEECRGQAPLSEDEFAEDELSLGGGEGDAGHPQAGPQCPAECPPHSGNSSLQGSTGNDLCRDLDSSDADDRSRFLTGPQGQGLVPGRNFSLPPGCRTRTSRGLHPHQHRGPAPDPRRPSRSLDRRRGWRGKPSPNQQPSPPSPAHGEFHEGLLLDALLQMYPNVVTVGGTPLVSGRINNRGAVPGGGGHHHAVPSVTHRLPYILPTPSPAPTRNHLVNPYESVPVLNHLHQHHHGYGPTRHPEMFTTFRPAGGGKANSQDSSFGSDSGYSNNTSGGRTTSSRGRKDAHRHSAHSGELTLS